jgi:FeS assembly SUF system protein
MQEVSWGVYGGCNIRLHGEKYLQKNRGKEAIYYMTQKESKIIDTIKTIYDPEISVNIYDLGLIYSIQVEDSKKVNINMTLTSAGCPFAQQIPAEVREKVLQIDEIEDVSVNLVWDPPWGTDQMTEVAKLELGMF